MWALLLALVGTATAGDSTSVTITLTATVVRPVEVSVPDCDDHATRNPFGCDAHHGRDGEPHGAAPDDLAAVPTSWVQPDGRPVTVSLSLPARAPAVALAW